VFSQTVSVLHCVPLRLIVKATNGEPLPETMTVAPLTSGVIALILAGPTMGRSQSSAPVLASSPTTLPCVIVTSWRTPAASVITGDP
jgi:hypothetical protein